MGMDQRMTMKAVQKNIYNFLEAHRAYFETYQIQAWIWSLFTPIVLFVPVYLWISAFDQFNITSVLQALLSVATFVTWGAIPGIFLFVNRGRHVIAEIWFWVWIGLTIIAGFTWALIVA